MGSFFIFINKKSDSHKESLQAVEKQLCQLNYQIFVMVV